ncbi:hypothetical protein DMUE_5514 [Dictyocoela muelleri]|nr:hypothetical protein DMUE_5514 [Dictyocoela muelleri]
MPELYDKMYSIAKERFKDKDFYMVFDETTDSRGRSILCILMGVCGEIKMEECIVVKTTCLEDTKSETINRELIRVLHEFIDFDFEVKRFKLVVSDQAANSKCSVTFLS